MGTRDSLQVAFVTPFCPHYRVRTFEMLARDVEVDYYFFSQGNEWYWQKQHGVHAGQFRHEYLPGIRLGPVRLLPTLPFKLLRGSYDVYIKCINGRFALPVTYAIARLKRKPFVLWTGIWMRLDSAAHRLAFPITRYIYRHADAVVVYGEHVRRYLISEGVAPERIIVAAHAVDNEVYSRTVPEAEVAALRHTLAIEPDQKVVLYLGRLEAGKGLSYLLEAFAMLERSDATLLLAGEGSEREALEQLAQARGVAERVRFSGYVATDQTLPYYALAWLSVLPSVTTPLFKEPWGLVVNEAYNQGVPVIATTAVGAAAGGLVQDGLNGLIVPERDSAALAQALRTLLDDAPLRQRMGQQARASIAEWDNERMVGGFHQAIHAVVTKSAVAPQPL